MSRSLFQEGGPHDIRKTGPDKYTFGISLPVDASGRIARECPVQDCSPGYFKVKPGTGITDSQEVAYCPYCRRSDTPDEFFTQEQIRYAKDIMMWEAHSGVNKMIRDTLKIGPSGRKRVGGGLVSLEWEYKPGPLPRVRRPLDEELRRDVVCPYCGLDHAVFGLANWCPDCGRDIFMAHVQAEFSVVSTILSDIDRRRNALGPRIAARDLENSLEDTVSIFEAVLRALVTRHLKESGQSEGEVQEFLRKKVGNAFQSVSRSNEVLDRELGLNLFEKQDEDAISRLGQAFEKRHPITHNLGVVDRKYLERALTAEREGREIRVTAEEIEAAIGTAQAILNSFHKRLFANEEGTSSRAGSTIVFYR